MVVLLAVGECGSCTPGTVTMELTCCQWWKATKYIKFLG